VGGQRQLEGEDSESIKYDIKSMGRTTAGSETTGKQIKAQTNYFKEALESAKHSTNPT